MKSSLRNAVWRFAVFAIVCVLGMLSLVMIFGQLRFQHESTYNAEFSDISGLQEGNFVRIAGVEVGKIKHISMAPDYTVRVEFSADETVTLTDATRAAIRFDNVIGRRFVELLEGTGGASPLRPGQTIPVSRTEPALDLDALIGGFRPLFRALDPDQVNALSTQLIQAFQGQGDTISSFLAQSASLTGTLADRDALIGQVIGNLDSVLGSLSGQSDQFAKAVDSLSLLVGQLATRKTDVRNAVAYTNAAAASLADLLGKARPPLKQVIAGGDRTAGLVLSDHDYFNDLLNTLPDAYQALARQGLYGDYFSFYMCELLLKVNGKGGQPVYVKLVGQPSGRCTPR